MASQKKFFKKNRIFLSKISILRNKKNFPGKTPVGISSYICLRNPYAKFEQNRMDSLGDRLFWHPQIQVQKTQTRARSRGPTQPRNLLYRIEIPAPSRGARASLEGIWHTSSKGMPRHAHGRWALVTVCGVDVSHVYVVVRTKRLAYVIAKCRQN